ncbi:MAG: tRNA lysidine(34) synthetase TilS [Chthoniobacterales bacterium]|nr:tRNA lysidine(34) synthetase TilS [Chthoniobacterales bacterium]
MKQGADLLPRFVKRLGPRRKDGRAIVGVSGGCDSVVLLDLLRRAGFRDLVVAHFHHGLRGSEADRDARFVRELAEETGAGFALGRGKTGVRAAREKESVEEAARKLRRAFFARTAKKTGATAVFLGHHANDAAETMLFHLARGSGRRGLASLRGETFLGTGAVEILRPLLAFTRAEIESHARSRKLAWREDKSNASREFTRNRLRHDVLPALARAVGHDPVPSMARAAEIMAAEEEWLGEVVAAEAGAAQLETRALRRMPVARRRRLLHAWLRVRTGGEIDFGTVEDARALAQSDKAPAKLNLPRAHHLRRRAGKLFVEKSPRPKKAAK